MSTLAEAMMQVGDAVAGTDVDGGSLADTITQRLNDVSGDLQSYINILNSFASILNSAQSIVATSQVMLPGLDSMVSTGQDTVNSMESLILAGNATTDTVTQMVTYSFDLVENSLNNVSMVVLNDMEKLQKYEDAAGNGLNATISVVPYLEKMFNDSVSSWEGTADDETRMQIQNVRDRLKMIELELNFQNTKIHLQTEVQICMNHWKWHRNYLINLRRSSQILRHCVRMNSTNSLWRYSRQIRSSLETLSHLR